MITNSKCHISIALIFVVFLLSLAAPLSNAAAQKCSTNCLSVDSMALADVGTYVNGTVKLIENKLSLPQKYFRLLK